MSSPTLLLEPLLRLMPLPPSLVRHAPLSAKRTLRSVPLRETPLVQGLGVEFDDTCLLSIGEDMDPAQLPLKLAVHGTRKRLSGVHLTLLSTKGQMTLLLGDNNVRLFVGTETSVRASIQLFRQSTLFIGDNTVIGQSRLVALFADMVIGEGCQLVEDVLVQGNDPHPLIDLAQGEILHAERQATYLGRRVLVQRRATLMPGVRIGDGAVVQACALVAGEVRPDTLVGGVPATVLREQVTWERDFARAKERLAAEKAKPAP